MNRRPNLIAPVIIVACALIVVGGIGTTLSGTKDPAATTAFPLGLPTNGTAIPAGTMPGATGAGAAATTGIATTSTGAGGSASASVPSPTVTAANVTAAETHPAEVGTAGHAGTPGAHGTEGCATIGAPAPVVQRPDTAP